MINFTSKGSVWRKCDLHAHTPIDHEWINRPELSTEEKKISFAKEFIEFAKEEGIELIGITDHNFCNHPNDLILPYIINEATVHSITILPGFEITVKDGSGIHLLVLFKENSSIFKIHEIVKRLFPLNTELIPSSGFVPVSDKDLDELKSILDESKLNYLLVFAHADRENGVLDKSTIGGTRRVQEWQKSYVNICQLSKKPEDFANGFIANVISKNDANYSRNITYIVASDCRSISKDITEESRHYLGQKFTWIKADASFEGLKQIIFEPSSRVRIQEDKPEQKRPHLYLDKVKFITDSKSHAFQLDYIELNQNLNCIIGGKSSGKSLLLYYIAKTIDPKQVEEKLSEFLSSNRYDFDKEIANFDFEVIWGDNTSYKFSDVAQAKTRQITYIPQMYINHLAEKKGNDELKKLIRSILEEKPEFLEFHSNVSTEISRVKGAISTNVFQYFEQKKKLNEIENKIRSKGDKKARIQNLTSRRDELALLRSESGFTESEETNYTDLLKKRSIHSSRKQGLEALQNVFEKEYLAEINRIEDISSKAIDILNQNSAVKFAGNKFLLGAYINISHKYKTLIGQSYQEVKENITSKIAQVKRCLTYTEEKISLYNEALKPYLEKITKKEKLDEIQNDISQEENILSQITELEQQKGIFKHQLQSYHDEIVLNYTLLMQKYQAIVQEVNSKYSEINPEKEIKLRAILSFDIEHFFNNCSKHISRYSTLSSIFGNYFEGNDFLFNEATHLDSIIDFFEKLLIQDIRYNQGGSQSLVCEKVFDDYFQIDFEIFQKEESIFRMSPGKKGLILLYLILHLSNASYPILVDQPEDNLDNRTVYKELKDFIKSKKIERQIIVVTHNANLVVPTDSENVIVANQSGQDKGKDNEKFKFEYVSGALENSFIDTAAIGILNSMGIREHVCEVLEGGEDAFKEREVRYSIHD